MCLPHIVHVYPCRSSYAVALVQAVPGTVPVRDPYKPSVLPSQGNDAPIGLPMGPPRPPWHCHGLSRRYHETSTCHGTAFVQAVPVTVPVPNPFVPARFRQAMAPPCCQIKATVPMAPPGAFMAMPWHCHGLSWRCHGTS